MKYTTKKELQAVVRTTALSKFDTKAYTVLQRLVNIIRTDDNKSFPGNAAIAKTTSMSLSSVERALAKLKADRVISKIGREYSFHLENLDALPDIRTVETKETVRQRRRERANYMRKYRANQKAKQSTEITGGSDGR
jgi:hypothetical protein